MGKIISVCDAKGMYEKSVIGVNIAISLSSLLKEEIAFLDLGSPGIDTIALLTNITPEKSISDLLPVLPALDSHLVKGYLTPSPLNVVFLGGVPTNKSPVDPSELHNLLRLISSAYPFTIVNAPDEYGGLLVSVLEASNLTLLNLSSDLFSLKRSCLFTDFLKTNHFRLDKVRLIVHKMATQQTVTAASMETYLGVPLLAEIRYDPGVILASINSSTPPVVSSPNGSWAVEIRELCATLMARELFADAPESGEGTIVDGAGKKGTMPFTRSDYKRLKETVHKRLLSDANLSALDPGQKPEERKVEEIRGRVQKQILDILAKENAPLPRGERRRFVNELLDEVLGLGCLETLLSDREITEIMVNGPDLLYIEKGGKIIETELSFTSSSQLTTIIDRIVAPVGRRLDEATPLVDARLPDGSRVNAVIPPISLSGPVVTIRKFFEQKLTTEDLIARGAMNPAMADFLSVCVRLKMNIVISGGTGSGKTTLLNVIASHIPADERIITIEDSAELRLPQKHVVRLEARPPSIEGSGAIPIRRLLINALRMRPDRIIIGECRGGEALDMLQAMNTGHDGSLTTVHANSPRDTVSRITTMAIMAGTDLPEHAIREQICSAIHIIVQLARLPDGSRKIIEISELKSRENIIETIPLFSFRQSGIREEKVTGCFTASGNLPSFVDHVAAHGLALDKNMFSKGDEKR